MTTNDQPATVTPPGWYVHPQTGQPAWWTGQGWTAAAPPPPTPPLPLAPPTPQRALVPQTQTQTATWTPSAPSGGGNVNQFGFPTSGPAFGTPARPSSSPARRSGGGGNTGTWLVGLIVVLALIGGGFLVFRGLGKTAAAGAQTGQQSIQQATNLDAKQALLNASQAMETWYGDHENYAIKGHVTGLSSKAHVEVSASEQGYCLRAYTSTGPAQGPANGSYWWYDSQGGGLQPIPARTSPTVGLGVCGASRTFTSLN